MTVTPRRAVANIWTDNPAAALDYEIAQEKASTLGRLGRALEARSRRCATSTRRRASIGGDAASSGATLVAQAGHALWLFVVQREALGLRDARQLMRDYRVPAEVQARMGMLPAKSAPLQSSRAEDSMNVW